MTKREIENLIDEKNRVQEKQQADSQLAGLVREMKSIFSRNNIKRDYDKLDKLRDHSITSSFLFVFVLCLPHFKIINLTETPGTPLLPINLI